MESSAPLTIAEKLRTKQLERQKSMHRIKETAIMRQKIEQLEKAKVSIDYVNINIFLYLHD
jgi:hypothetical protein